MSLESKRSNLIASHSDGLASRKENINGPKKNEPYFVDEKNLHNLIQQQKSALHWYNQLLQSYLSLDLGPGNMETLQKLQDGDLNEFKVQFFAKVESELAKTGITNSQILETLRAGTDQPWITFIKSIEVNNSQIDRIRKLYPDVRLDMNYFSIKNNTVMFDNEDQERMKNERASVYLDSTAKQSFSMLCETILQDLNKLNTRCQDNGIKVMFGGDGVFSILQNAGRQTIHFNKTIINHITF